MQSLGYRSTGAVDHPAPGSLALARDSTRRQEWAQYSAIGPNRRCVAGSFAFESQPAGSGVDREPRYGFHYDGAKQALCPASRGPRLRDAWEMNRPGRPTVRGVYRTAGHQASAHEFAQRRLADRQHARYGSAEDAFGMVWPSTSDFVPGSDRLALSESKKGPGRRHLVTLAPPSAAPG